MSTQIKNSKKSTVKLTAKKGNRNTPKNSPAPTVINNMNSEGDFKNVPVADIDFSPLNYRKFFSKTALDDFAAELAVHGIISPLTLRLMPSGRYELVAGERRLRAALIAGMLEIPAIVKVLTDDEVTEIQLAENLQRENPHPMHEAQAIGQMQKKYKTVQAIAARLGKPKTFVYSRIKFLDLIEPIQEVFVADAINMQEAFDIAAISAESQREFFDQYCADWKDEANFKINNLRYALSRFRYDLKNAPFDTKDKKLFLEMGACTNCPFNSATLKSLFPELAKQAACTKKDCYQTKCDRHLTHLFQSAFATHKPQAVIFNWALTESLQKLLNTIDGIEKLPKYGKMEVTIIQAPVMPDKDDYTNEYTNDGGEYEDDEYNGDEDFEEEEYNNEASSTPVFDEAGYGAALHEYEADLEEYNHLIQNGDLLKGLLVSETKAELVMYSLEVPTNTNNNKATATAKEVQEAIKAGTVTPELLKGEVERIKNREQRAKELDREKVHLNIHEAFKSSISDSSTVTGLTDADLVAARLFVYQSLDWSARNKINAELFAERTSGKGKELSFYEALQNLTDQQYSYMIRTALASKSDSKFPNNDTGAMTRKVAGEAGIDINAMEEAQQQKVKDREEKQEIRILELQKKIDKLQQD